MVTFVGIYSSGTVAILIRVMGALAPRVPGTSIISATLASTSSKGLLDLAANCGLGCASCNDIFFLLELRDSLFGSAVRIERAGTDIPPGHFRSAPGFVEVAPGLVPRWSPIPAGSAFVKGQEPGSPGPEAEHSR